MKKFYSLPLLLLTAFISAQINISFEADEAYNLGNLHDQNGWEVTESSDGIIQHQTISDDLASDGVYSFKNGHEPDYDFQWFPIFGGSLSFNETISSDLVFSISYDILVTGQQGADFEFTVFGINANEEYEPIAGVGIENRGLIYVINSGEYASQYTEANWEINDWNTVMVEVNMVNILYYLNDELIASVPRFNEIDALGINFLHNNYGHDAYYDNIEINHEVLSTNEMISKSEFSIYPNPVLNNLNISIENNQIKNASIYDMSGKIVAKYLGHKSMNLEKLAAGNYIIHVTTADGKKYQRKFIKK